MTAMEGRSLLRGGLFLFVLALFRIGFDQFREGETVLPEGETELPRLLAESRALRDEETRRSMPLGQGETVDPNRSGEEELDRLPGIGPATARALVAHREEMGGFARPEDLLQVRGIGPATMVKIRPHLDLSGGVPVELRSRRTDLGRGSGEERRSAGGGGLTYASDSTLRPGPPVDLNRAVLEELESLPGIGPTLARRILESRRREGPFRKAEDLLRVKGIGPATLARLRGRVIPGG